MEHNRRQFTSGRYLFNSFINIFDWKSIIKHQFYNEIRSWHLIDMQKVEPFNTIVITNCFWNCVLTQFPYGRENVPHNFENNFKKSIFNDRIISIVRTTISKVPTISIWNTTSLNSIKIICSYDVGNYDHISWNQNFSSKQLILLCRYNCKPVNNSNT